MKKVSFIYAYPLDVGRRKLFEEKDLGNYPSSDEIREVLDTWKTLWHEVNADDRVMAMLAGISKRTPERALECFVFGRGLSPMSTPFLIPIMVGEGKVRSDESFIQTMIHELFVRIVKWINN